MADHVGTTALSAQVATAFTAIATPDGLSAPSGDNGTVTSADQALRKTHDATSEGIRAVLVSASSATYGTKLNAEHVWKDVYDPTTVAIRMIMV